MFMYKYKKEMLHMGTLKVDNWIQGSTRCKHHGMGCQVAEDCTGLNVYVKRLIRECAWAQ